MQISRFISLQFCGAVLGLIGVILGAATAHGSLHDTLEGNGHMEAWQTALQYQWFHALAFLAVSKHYDPRFPKFGYFWLFGTILFSGSIYFLSLATSFPKWVGLFTPAGGILLIIGWVLLACKSRPT